MIKLERNTIKLVNLQVSEDELGNITIDSINVTGVDTKTNDVVVVTQLTAEAAEAMGRDVGNIVKNIVRYSLME